VNQLQNKQEVATTTKTTGGGRNYKKTILGTAYMLRKVVM
jgi:hypothetical protein